MNAIFIIFRTRLLMFWRNKAAVAITFLVPIALIALFGFVFGLYKNSSGPGGIPLAVVNLSADPVAKDLITDLQAEKALRIVTETNAPNGSMRSLTEADARQAMHDDHYRFALIIPKDFIPEHGFGLRLKFLSDPRNEIESQMVNGLLQKTIFSHLPQLLGQSLQKRTVNLIGQERYNQFNRSIANTVTESFGGDPEKLFQSLSSPDFGFGEITRPTSTARTDPTLRSLDTPSTPGTTTGTPAATVAPATGASDLIGRILQIETEQVAGKQVSNPMAARTVGGYAIMFLLFALSGSASSLFEEKQTGIFERILSAPVRPAHILWGRFLYGIFLGVVQITVLFLAGDLLFGLGLWPHFGALLVVAVAAAAACTSFGLLLAAIAPNAEAAGGLATLLVLTMSSVGGAWFPVSIMPEFIQKLSKLTLVYWAVEGFTAILWAGQSLLEVLPKVGVLSAMAAFVMAIATWRFKRGKMFN